MSRGNVRDYVELEEISGILYPVVYRKGEEKIVCPYCNCFHGHSKGDGHRYSHCVESVGYFKEIMVRGHVIPKQRGYIIRDIK